MLSRSPLKHCVMKTWEGWGRNFGGELILLFPTHGDFLQFYKTRECCHARRSLVNDGRMSQHRSTDSLNDGCTASAADQHVVMKPRKIISFNRGRPQFILHFPPPLSHLSTPLSPFPSVFCSFLFLCSVLSYLSGPLPSL